MRIRRLNAMAFSLKSKDTLKISDIEERKEIVNLLKNILNKNLC